MTEMFMTIKMEIALLLLPLTKPAKPNCMPDKENRIPVVVECFVVVFSSSFFFFFFLALLCVCIALDR